VKVLVTGCLTLLKDMKIVTGCLTLLEDMHIVKGWLTLLEDMQIVTGCLTLLEDMQITWSLLLIWLFRLSYSFTFFWFFFYHCVYGCMFCVLLFNSVSYVFLFLCMLCSVYSVLIVPTSILRLPWLRFFRAFSSVVKQIPGYNSQRRGTARTLPN
jgi:hypothetical protein